MNDYDITPEQASHGRVIPDRELPMIAAQWLVDATTRHFCGESVDANLGRRSSGFGPR